MTPIEVLAVASEIYPFIKTGGLADVVGALPPALSRVGVRVVTLVPGYPSVKQALDTAEVLLEFDALFGGAARLLSGRAAGLDLLILDAPHLFDRLGNPYTRPDGGDWPDNALRFAALGWVAARIGLAGLGGYRPDIVHGHDWQAGLAMAYLAYDGGQRPSTVLTVHNLSYQGQFPSELLGLLRLPPHAFSIDGVEYYGMIGFLKAGLRFADRITTVSPTYAREIQAPENGCGLDGLLRARAGALVGIRNGIDIAEWNPETDRRIEARYGSESLASRARNKVALQRRFGLAVDADRLLFAVVSRLVWQKGLDLLVGAASALVQCNAQLAVLGNGEAHLERQLDALTEHHPGTLACSVGYDEDFAHLIQAGADAILVPSRFEPCGLTQLCAMRYGAIPVVAKVGGLADTVVDPANEPAQATGMHFYPVTQEALEAAIHRAAALWADRPGWRAVQAKAMLADVSWAEPAAAYRQLYMELLSK